MSWIRPSFMQVKWPVAVMLMRMPPRRRIGQRTTILQLLPCEDETLLLRGDPLLLLDLGLDILDGVRLLHIQGDRLPCERFDKDLHGGGSKN
uniref:Uncharacterized protein n=1 Tax=Meloidogyne incognita TaxID=6306 RepID=A0A914KS88_MELIC